MIDEEIWIESIIPCDITDTEIICNELIKTNTKKILFLEEGTQYFNWGSGIISELVQKSNDFTIKQNSSKDFIIPTSVNAELEVLPSLINIKT